MQTYPWFDQVPEHLKTRRQLADLGLRPGGPVGAQVVWRRGKAHADLYDKNAALPKREMTDAQRAALEKAQEKRRTCRRCGTVFSFVLGYDFDCPECFRRMLVRDRQAAVETARLWLRSKRTIVLDTETTDLDGYLVELAIIDTAGNVLFNRRINPQAAISAGAGRIHGITDADLEAAPTFVEVWPEVWPILRGRRIVSYNSGFDSHIFVNEVERRIRAATSTWPNYHETRHAAMRLLRMHRGSSWRCAMHLYAAYCGDWSDYHNDYRWQPLPGGDHSALGDARACLAVLKRMAATTEEGLL